MAFAVGYSMDRKRRYALSLDGLDILNSNEAQDLAHRYGLQLSQRTKRVIFAASILPLAPQYRLRIVRAG